MNSSRRLVTIILIVTIVLMLTVWAACVTGPPSEFLSHKGEGMERKVASDYPQELLDLFHEYQHGDISRRTFLNRAGKFAVGGLTVAAIFESLRPNYAWAQQVAPDDKHIKVGYEVVQSPAGNGSIKGYLARPAQGKKHAVV